MSIHLTSGAYWPRQRSCRYTRTERAWGGPAWTDPIIQWCFVEVGGERLKYAHITGDTLRNVRQLDGPVFTKPWAGAA